MTEIAPVRSGLARRFASAREGVAAVEFALILPVLITMLLGMAEVTLGVNIDRKLTLLSRTLADLTSRTPAMTTTEMSNVFSAATAVLQPYSSSTLAMVVTSVTVTNLGNNTYRGNVAWSCGKGNGLSAKATNAVVTVPSGFETSSSFILVETRLPYNPLFGYAITGTINLAETTPWPVRNVSQVTYTGSCPA